MKVNNKVYNKIRMLNKTKFINFKPTLLAIELHSIKRERLRIMLYYLKVHFNVY